MGTYKRPGFGASQINFSDFSWRLWALGIGAALRNSKCVDYTGGWPHGVDECVWRLPPGAVMASPFGDDETRTQLSAHVSALRKTFPPFMANPAGGAVPLAWCWWG